MAIGATWTDHRYHGLGERFFLPTRPVPVTAPRLLLLNEALAADLGLDVDWLRSDDGVAALAGNAVVAGTRPAALAYAGHQFGQFVPVLGDGRAVLLGEATDRAGRRMEIQLKGAGQTPFSRRGDGRAALGPVLREYIVSEAMAAFGIPTTRSLAVIATGDAVYREAVLPGAILVRVASSHVRVGTFQYFAARGDREALRLLLDDVVARSYPALADLAAADKPMALLAAAAERQLALVAAWMAVGFIHGVMNTDNVALSGETLDYGPCAFLDAYHPDKVFSSIDQHGRYAYGNQPRMAGFAMARLAETLLPLVEGEREAAIGAAQAAIDRMAAGSAAALSAALLPKIGLSAATPGADDLLDRMLGLMTEAGADFTIGFTALTDLAHGRTPARPEPVFETEAGRAWLGDWRAALGDAPEGPARMARANPRFIPRNHRIEAAIAAAVATGSLQAVEDLLTVVRRPYDEHSGLAHLADPPTAGEEVLRTYCGT